MDPATQYPYNARHGRNGSQSTNSDRQLSDSSSTLTRPRQSSVCVGLSRQSIPNRHNSTVCLLCFFFFRVAFVIYPMFKAFRTKDYRS